MIDDNCTCGANVPDWVWTGHGYKIICKARNHRGPLGKKGIHSGRGTIIKVSQETGAKWHG